MANNIFVTSDWHINHDKIIEYCNRPKDHEEKIFKNMQFLEEQHTLICLGDICIGKDKEVHERFVWPLKCSKVLVMGNHDRKSWSWYMDHGWDLVCKGFELNMFGKKLFFSHEPKWWNKEWDINVHGHLHNSGHRKNKVIEKVHRLIALEETGYKPVNLRKLIER